MAVRPIITVDVDDSAFKRFYDLYKGYSEDIEKQPEAWRDLGKAMGESSKELETGAVSAKEALAIAAAQAGLISEALLEATKAQKNFGKETETSAKGMDKFAKSAGSVAKGIALVAGGIVKMAAAAGLGALFGGLGIGELTDAAFNRFRSAGQLGVNPGLLASFQANAQQFLGTPALEGAANAQIDASKAGYLATLGIGFGRARGMNPSDLAFTELKSARAAYIEAQRRGYSPMQSPAVMAYLAMGGSLGDVRNAAGQPLSDIQNAQNATNRDVGALNFSRQTAQSWIVLKRTLDEAGFAIQTDLIDHLAPLAPGIATLAKDVERFINAFTSSKNFDVVIKDLGDGLEWLGKYLGGDKFQQDLKGLQIGVGKVSAEIMAVADKLSWLIPPPAPKREPFVPQQLQDLWHWFTAPIDYALGKGKYAKYGATGAGNRPVHNPLDFKLLSGNGSGFAQFATTEAGILGGAKRLAEFPKVWNIPDTLTSILATWAPSGDGNNPSAYAKNVELWSGVNRNLSMKKWTKEQFAAVISAMSREEGTDPVSTKKVFDVLYAHRSAVRSAGRKAAKPTHVSITNHTAARVAVSLNAASAY